MDDGRIDGTVRIEGRVDLAVRYFPAQRRQYDIRHADGAFELRGACQGAQLASELREVSRLSPRCHPIALLVQIEVESVGVAVEDGLGAQEPERQPPAGG